jgi:hypothetical protein
VRFFFALLTSVVTSKVIQYGLLCIFAAAFPLAPLIVMVVSGVTMRTSARRLIFLCRRPLPRRQVSC